MTQRGEGGEEQGAFEFLVTRRPGSPGWRSRRLVQPSNPEAAKTSSNGTSAPRHRTENGSQTSPSTPTVN